MALFPPEDQEVKRAASKTVLALDAPASVDDALEESHQHQMRTGLPVAKALGREVSVLAPKDMESSEQFLAVKTPVRPDIPGWVVGNGHLADVGQRPRDHLSIDGIGDLGKSPARGDQTEAEDISEVVVEDVRRELVAHQHGLDDPLDAGLAQAGHERVDV